MTGNGTKIIIVAQADVETPDGEGLVQLEEHLIEDELHESGLEGYTEEGHSAVFPPFDASTFGSQLLWLALSFVFLYVVMSRVALPRIGGILESRRTRIEGDLKEADRLRKESDRAAEEYEAALAAARQNAHAIAEETRSGIRADIEMKRADVEADLAKKMAEAEARIAGTKEAALANVDTIASDTLRSLMERLTGPVSDEQVRDAVASVAGQDGR